MAYRTKEIEESRTNHKQDPACNWRTGPSDRGYMSIRIRLAAGEVQSAVELYCEGHYPHSNARDIPDDHPLVIALKALEQADKELNIDSGWLHQPEHFAVYKPPEENKTRWDKYGKYGTDGDASQSSID